MKLLYTIVLLFSITHIYAQDPILQKNNDSLDKIATKITKAYDEEIALDGKQFVLFQKKVEEFLIREENIHNTFSGVEKLNYLNELRKAETLEMRNVLTDIQYSLYKKIKPEIQPLSRVKSPK